MSRRLFIPGIAALLAGCSSLPAMPSLPDFGLGKTSENRDDVADVKLADLDTPLSASASARDQVNRAIHLLGAGRVDEARQRLRAALEKSPSDRTALGLVEQIDGDPVALLGKEHRLHTVVAGDTMSALAERYLGDSLKFFVLSRYNGLDSPSALRVGVSLKMPTGNLAAPTSAATNAVVPSPSPANAAKADALRLQGLEALNKGDINRAVALLRNAEALDTDDPAIERDLQRALRIQASLGQ